MRNHKEIVQQRAKGMKVNKKKQIRVGKKR